MTRKFQQLYSTSEPTGDPNIPPDVLQAKKLYQEIKKKAEIAEGVEEEELEPDPDDEPLDGKEGDVDKDAAGVCNSHDNNLAAALQEVEEASLQMAPPEDPSHLHRYVVITQHGDDNNDVHLYHLA